mgnify:CR=1 FL=1
MPNPRSLVHALYTHWDVVEVLVRLSREFAALTRDQVWGGIHKVSPQLDAEGRDAVLRSLVNADILQGLPRSNDLQINVYVLEFVRGLTHEHELGLAAVLQARVAAIREATESLNESVQRADMDRVRGSVGQLSEIFRQIRLQLEQDRHALLDLADAAKSAEGTLSTDQRYRRVLEAYDRYVEPMNQMMDTGVDGTFYRYLESAEQALDSALDRLSARGALYSHRLQIRQVSHQAKELRHFGRVVANQCADTLLPLREEIRQYNALTRSIGMLLGRVRKRGARRALPLSGEQGNLPLWRTEWGFKLYLGDEVRAIMAAAQSYQPPIVEFPQDLPVDPSTEPLWEPVDEDAIRAHLADSLPVDNLLDWLTTHYPHLEDATLLRIFHDLSQEPRWSIEAAEDVGRTDLRAIRVVHHPHSVSSAS